MINKIKSIRTQKKLLSNILSLTVLQGANYILPLITLPYLVITLGVEKFGILAFAQAIITYLNTLVDYGFNLSATRAIATNSQDSKNVSSVFISVILIKIFLLCVSFVILSILISSFDRIGSEALVYYMAFGALIGNLLFPVWYFQGTEDMKYITYINILSKLLFTVAIFVFVHEQADYALVPMLNSLGLIIGGAIALFIAIRRIEFHIPTFGYVKSIFKESTSLFVSNASISLFTASNTLILGLFASDAVVGIYAAMERLMTAIKYFYAPLYQGLFPWLAKKDRVAIVGFVSKFFPYIGVFGLLVTILIAAFAHPILTLIYQNKTISDHYEVLQIFSLVSVLSATSLLFNYLFLNVMREYKERMRILLITGFFNVISGTILAYSFGLIGVVCSVTATEALLLTLSYLKFQSIKRSL